MENIKHRKAGGSLGLIQAQADFAVNLTDLYTEKIRAAMIDMGTTLPENLPTPDKSIQIIEREEIRKLRESKTPLMLDE